MKYENIPLAPEHCVKGFGTAVIFAPHADDESLGCGGLIALLRKYQMPVFIVLLSDGTLSHPNSKKYPADDLRDLREQELLDAAQILGVEKENVIFCRFKDRSVPSLGSEFFEKAVQNISKMLGVIQPESIFVPWRRDPHPDHKAAYQLVDAAEKNHAKVYEYPIWLTELGTEEDSPADDEVAPFRLNIETVLDRKIAAISQHRSQITDMIDDDPKGFRLSEEMINQFKVPYETFFISK